MNNLVFFVLGIGLTIVMAETQPFYTSNVPVGKEEIVFDSTAILANQMEMVHLDCGMKGHTEDPKACTWTKTNGIETLNFQVLDVYQGVFSSKGKPENETENQCGIVLKSIKHVDHGVWKCAIFILGKSMVAEKTVKVTVQPTEVLAPNNVTANADVETAVNCTVGQAEPPATITWTLNGTNITNEATEEVKANTGNSSTISILRHKFAESENNQILKCIITHPRLENPQIEEISVIVGIAPDKQMEEQTFWNISKSSEHIITVDYKAFPKPTHNIWKHGAKNITSDGHFITSLHDFENGTYHAELKIVALQDDDYEHKYSFEVKNMIGKALYKFNISMQEDPKGGSNSVNSAWILYTLLSILALYL